MNTEDILTILDEQEETYIRQIAENEQMQEAIKKVILAPLYVQGTIKKGKKVNLKGNWVFSILGNNNENLGAVVRARAEGIQLIEEGFNLLLRFKKQEQRVENVKNPAR